MAYTDPERAKKYGREYRIKNKELLKEKAKKYNRYRAESKAEWAKNNRDRMNAAARKYYDANRAVCNARTRAWQEANKHRFRDTGARATRRRRQRLGKSPGKYSYTKWMLRVEYFSWTCRYCGTKLTESTLTKDHQIPVCRGGSDWPANLVPACFPCNHAKHTKTYKEFMA